MNRDKKKRRKVSETDNMNYTAQSVKHQSISIQKWCEYAKSGIEFPVKIPLYGNSMEPLIRYKKDIVTVVPLKRELIPGDIVLFKRQDGIFVIHRIYKVNIQGRMVQTWGDNCFFPDQPVKLENVLGLVVCVDKNGKKYMLDTEKQRTKGVQWMNSVFKRKCWFIYREIRAGVIRCKYYIACKMK